MISLQNMNNVNQKLQWVSEWRIVPNNDSSKYPFKISNGEVYTIAKDIREAQLILQRNIKDEQRQYHIESLKCPNCGKRFAEHEGLVTYRHCLLQLAQDGLQLQKNVHLLSKSKRRQT